jgi:hypothetical protein
MVAQIVSHKDPIVWQQAMDLMVAVYTSTRKWPKQELYGLTSQARRAAVSIPANIAEGFARGFLPTIPAHCARVIERA